jgi:tetratricopeptide (TPR) repeat protein
VTPRRRRRGYGFRLLASVAAVVLITAGALTVLFKVRPAFEVDVFGTADPGERGRGGAAGVRPEDDPGVRVGRTGDPGVGAPSAPGPGSSDWEGWTDAGLDAARSAALGEARRLATAKEWTRALALYDRLVRENPRNDVLAIERARVLSWSGNNAAAAAALAEVAARRPGDAALRTEAARYYAWAGRAAEADSLAGEALALAPRDAVADSLRREVRRSTLPTVATAERWLREESGPTESAELALAHALVREQRFAEALPHFRAAARGGADSVLLELASVALAADSSAAAAAALEQYLRTHPNDQEARTTLARAYNWSRQYEAAIPVYASLLARRDDPLLRFEMAQAQAWSGQLAAAEANLLALVEAHPGHAEGLKLLGDLARWRGEPSRALGYYTLASSLNPRVEGLQAALREVEREERLAMAAATPLPPEEYRVEVESFGDNQGFRWASAQVVRQWRPRWGVLEVDVRNDYLGGGSGPGAPGGTAGFGVCLAAEADLFPGIRFRAQAGTRGYADVGLFGVWGAEIRFADYLTGFDASLAYLHQPGVRRAGTLAALYGESTSDLLQATLSGTAGRWLVWTQAEVEQLRSDLGSSRRYAASAVLRRPIARYLDATLGFSALTTTGATPSLERLGSLWWSPEYYLAPSLGLAYRAPVGERWAVEASVTPGYAFVRERAGGERRFEPGATPTLAVGAGVEYQAGPWTVGAAGSWGGAVGPGYRAGGVRVHGTYRIPRR